MTRWLFDEQRQMVEAARYGVSRHPATPADAEVRLRRAFAAIDREALIEKAYTEKELPHIPRRDVEAVLVAAGVISERES